MKVKLLLLLLFYVCFLNAQSNKELANKYLKERGELVFTFTANNIEEVRSLANIISFDHGQDQSNPLVIKAIANSKNFNFFLSFNLPFTIDKHLNEPKDVVMFNPIIHKKKGVSGKNATYPLSFPLVAYPTYQQYADQMAAFAADHSAIAELVDIGGTVQGDKRLLFIKLSDNVSTREVEPRVMYTSSMHGDEIAGFPSMLNLIDYFITAYEDIGHSDHSRVKNLLDNSEVWINPMANPDATYWLSSDNSTVANSRRENANNVDLNRNYPDNVQPSGHHPDWNSYELETQHFMSLADNYHFVLSANFHGGTEVVNYPWDNTSTRHPDDDWYFLVSKEYAVNCQTDGHSGYMDAEYNNFVWPGVTNGSDWYTVYGGRQDYMNFSQQCKETTVELSNVKTPPASPSGSNDILDIWNYNKDAYLDYLIQGTYGFRGIVKDASTNNPIKAKVTLIGHDALGSWVETELFPGTELGDFYRPIDAGTYDILIESDCYSPVILTNQTIANYQTIDLSTILLTSTTDVIPNNLFANNVTNSDATLNWDSTGGTSYDIQYRIQGDIGWTSTSSSTNSLNISGLNSNTIYEFQVRGVCNSTNSDYSIIKTFTTILSYCSSYGTTGSRGITNVTFNTINSSDTNNANNSYEDFTFNSTDVDLGSNIQLSVRVNTGNGNTTMFARAFIDFNKDGDFNDLGESINLGSANKVSDGLTSLTPTINIPNDAVIGSARMRISAKNGGYPSSCETGFDGEVEDYTLNIIDSSLGIEDEILSTFQLYPNPVSNGEIKLSIPREITDFNITISNVLGQKMYENSISNNYEIIHTVNTTNLKSGIYFVTVSTNLGKATKKLIIQE